jgi:hypothetical protein
VRWVRVEGEVKEVEGHVSKMGCDVDASWQEKKNGPKTPSRKR